MMFRLQSFVPEIAASLPFCSREFLLLFTLFASVWGLLRNRMKPRLGWLLLFSYYFYYRCNGVFVVVLAMLTVLDWAIAIRLEDTALVSGCNAKPARAIWVAFGVSLNLLTLGFFKYANFFLHGFAVTTQRPYAPLAIFLPIGISFHVFQSVSYLLDVYQRKLKPTRSLVEYALYLSFFPQVVAGPIVRASEFLPQLRGPIVLVRQDVDLGLFRVLRGLTKKAILADYLGQYVDLVFVTPNAYSGAEVALGIYAYSVQLYLDFSGYSDIAVGLARLLGIRLPENFDSPYRATSLTEFWHRWHVSLCSWLRDYLYIPLGGNRKGRTRQALNLIVTMLLGGLWHGASLTFVVWGFLHGVVLALEKALGVTVRAPHTKTILAIRRVLTFHVVTALWVLFRAPSFSGAEAVMSRLTTGWHLDNLRILLEERLWICLAIPAALVGNLVSSDWVQRIEGWFRRSPWVLQTAMLVSIGLAIYGASRANVRPFIYYQF